MGPGPVVKTAVVAAVALAAAGGGRARADDGGSDSLDSLPGLVRVATAAPMTTRLTLSAGSGYGYRGAVLASNDRHHRLAGRLAASWRIRSWLAVGLRLDGRYDRHIATPSGTDDGWVGDPRLLVRAVRPLGARLAIGGEVGLWFPASSALSLAGTSVEARGITSYRATDQLTLAVNAGGRLDRSSNTVADPEQLSLADRMALGASDANAVTLGVGAGWRRGSLALVADWSWDLLIGADAPRAVASPMRVSGGARLRVANDLWLHGTVQIGVSATPEVALSAPLVPVEPRLLAMLGATYRFGRAAARSGGGTVVVPPPAPALGTVAGRVVDTDGAPIAGATVRAGERETTTDDDGRFELTGVPIGTVQLEIIADGHRTVTTRAQVGADSPVAVAVRLERALPPGQIRGLVRSLSGKPIAGARVTVKPLGRTLRTGDDGSFRVDVAPGNYTLVVEARHYARQQRQLKVDQNGVTVINLELRKNGGR